MKGEREEKRKGRKERKRRTRYGMWIASFDELREECELLLLRVLDEVDQSDPHSKQASQRGNEGQA